MAPIQCSHLLWLYLDKNFRQLEKKPISRKSSQKAVSKFIIEPKFGVSGLFPPNTNDQESIGRFLDSLLIIDHLRERRGIGSDAKQKKK